MGNHKENMSCLQTCNLDHVMVGIHLASNGTNKLYTFHFVTSSSFWRLGCLKRLKVMLVVIVRLARSNFASRAQPAGSLLEHCRSCKTKCSSTHCAKPGSLQADCKFTSCQGQQLESRKVRSRDGLLTWPPVCTRQGHVNLDIQRPLTRCSGNWQARQFLHQSWPSRRQWCLRKPLRLRW